MALSPQPQDLDGRTRSTSLRLRIVHDAIGHAWSRGLASANARKTLGSVLWAMASALAGRLLGIVSSVLTARVLGVTAFGEFNLVQSTAGMLQSFAGFGMGTTATKYVSEFRDRDPRRASTILAISELVSLIAGCIAAIALIAGAHLIAVRVLENPGLTSSLQIAAGLLFAGAVTGAFTGGLSGLQAFRAMAIYSTAAAAFAAAGTVAGAMLAGRHGAVAGATIGALIQVPILWRALQRACHEYGIKTDYRNVLAEVRIIRDFGLPATLSNLLLAPVTWLCTAIMTRQPSGVDAIGIYGAATQWRTAILFVPGTIGIVLLPLLSSLSGSGDGTLRFRRVLRANVIVTLLSAGLATIFVCAAARPIMSGYGPDFAGHHGALRTVAASGFLAALANILGQVLVTHGRMWLGLVLNCIWGVAILSLTWAWRAHGAQGMATASLVAYGIHFVTSALVAWRLLRTHAS